jgi:hypothetical protein
MVEVTKSEGQAESAVPFVGAAVNASAGHEREAIAQGWLARVSSSAGEPKR